jgi:DNA polymerase I-like protein with 3'-5' exonuclease and polymerase domains
MQKRWTPRGPQREKPASVFTNGIQLTPNLTNLVHISDPCPLDNERAFELDLATSRNWDNARHRLLLVQQTVLREDLRSGQLLTKDTPSYSTIRNLLGETFSIAKGYDKRVDPEDWAIRVVNWNAAKVFDLSPVQEQRIWPLFTKRVERHIELFKPTIVVIAGDQAASSILPNIPNIEYKRGWVHTVNGIKYVNTLDINALVDPGKRVDDDSEESSGNNVEKGKEADLLFYVCRNLVHGILGKHPHSIRHIQPNPSYIGTIERFDKLMDVLDKNDTIAWDIETQNLEAYTNKIYTMQFAVSTDRGYVLPIDHPRTPFDEDEIVYIKGKLRKFFASRTKLKKLIGQNLAFDLRVTMAQLKIDIIYHTVHDLTAGESLLDENLGIFGRTSLRYGQLESRENFRAIVTSYDNDWYFTAKFSKEDRMNIGMYPADERVVLEYSSGDVIFALAIYHEEIKAAYAYTIYDWKKGEYVNYGDWYIRHLEEQMSATSHALAMLIMQGSAVDTEYMQDLMLPDSILQKALTEEMDKLKNSPIASKVNEKLLKESGVPTTGLFGAKKKPWILNLSKPGHKQALFIEEMKIEPLTHSDKTGKPQIDKRFTEAYKDEYLEVSIFFEFQELTKLLSTYVKGWLKKLAESGDSVKDKRFRSYFQFFRIVTGRLGSERPNHQNIPSRGKRAKIIKRMFRANRGWIQIRADLSAHEIRVWAISANDKELLKSFKEGLTLRQELVTAETDDERKSVFDNLKKRGDVHIQNVYRIFKVWVGKNHVLRDRIKNIGFGLLYGLGLKAMAAGMRLNSIRALIHEVEALKDELKKLEV